MGLLDSGGRQVDWEVADGSAPNTSTAQAFALDYLCAILCAFGDGAFSGFVGKESITETLATEKISLAQHKSWGDEMEYIAVAQNSMGHFVPCCAAQDAVNILNKGLDTDSMWSNEYAAYMLEAMPSVPCVGISGCTGLTRHLELRNLKAAIALDRTCSLHKSHTLLAATTFPRLGLPDTWEEPLRNNGADQTHPRCMTHTVRIFPEYAVCRCLRFQAVTRAVTQRSGRSVCIPLPVQSDRHTDAALKMITLNATGFGMGMCAAQVTVQMATLGRAAAVHDAMAALAPVLLALSAATPVQSGVLCTTDTRISSVSASVDDRRDISALDTRPRYGCVAQLLTRSNGATGRVHQTGTFQRLLTAQDQITTISAASKTQIALHFAGIIERGSLVVPNMSNLVSTCKCKLCSSDHACIRGSVTRKENEIDYVKCTARESAAKAVLSTAWPVVRLTVPESQGRGWCVEVRPLETQPSPFENAAFISFVYLAVRALEDQCASSDAPPPWMDVSADVIAENITRAQQIDAYKNALFETRDCPMSCDAIINGDQGIAKMIWAYLERNNAVNSKVSEFVDFVCMRAAGSTCTVASEIRRLVVNHPAYGQDSNVPAETCDSIVAHLIGRATLQSH